MQFRMISVVNVGVSARVRLVDTDASLTKHFENASFDQTTKNPGS